MTTENLPDGSARTPAGAARPAGASPSPTAGTRGSPARAGASVPALAGPKTREPLMAGDSCDGAPGHGPGAAAEGKPHAAPGSTPRTWVIELPAGLKTISPNDRLHWSQERSRARELKKAAWALALRQKIPHLGRAAITVEFRPPDRRRRDRDNIPARSGKHCIDGIVAAGVLDDDSPEFIDGPFYAFGGVVKGGQLVLTITEIAGDDR